MITSVRSSVYNNFHVQVKIIGAARKPNDGRISKVLLSGMRVGGGGGGGGNKIFRSAIPRQGGGGD